jgi:hypothetical protein
MPEMKKVYYFAVWTDDHGIQGCAHEHQTVTSAAACINCAGGFVLAVEKHLRGLTEAEEAEFQLAHYGIGADSRTKSPSRRLGWFHRIWV